MTAWPRWQPGYDRWGRIYTLRMDGIVRIVWYERQRLPRSWCFVVAEAVGANGMGKDYASGEGYPTRQAAQIAAEEWDLVCGERRCSGGVDS